MPNWLASELCMVVSFSLGAWKTFKVLKHGGTDYNLLKTWCLLGLLRVFEGYFEFLVSWIPFYWLGKCVGLALLFLPGGNIPSVVFEKIVVWGMDNAHDILNNLVVPNVVEFAVSLPWRVLLVLFPAMPPPPTRRAGLHAKKGVTKRGNGLAHRLQHLKVPTPPMSPGVRVNGDGERQDSPHRAGVTAEIAPLSVEKRVRSVSPPPLPPRTPFKTPGERDENVNLAGQTGAAGNIGGDEAGGLREYRPTNLNTTEVLGNISGGDVGSPGYVAATPPSRGGVRGEAVLTEDSSPEARVGGSGRRKSFGEIVRSALTGNSEVRLRDHLFDLNTASPAPPQPTTPREPPQPDPPTAAASAAAASPNQERGHAKDQASDAAAAAAAALPPFSDTADSGKRRAGRELGAVTEGPLAVSSAATRPRYSTRRRPSELSESSSFRSDGSSVGGDGGGGGGGGRRRGSGGGRGGGVEAGGRTSEDSSRGIRRRNPPGRRSQDNTNNPYTSNPARSSNATNGGSANTTAVGTADSRAQRLVEWRKRREDQASAQQKDRSRKSRMAGITNDAANAAPDSGPNANPSLDPAAAVAAGASGAAAAAPGGPGARRPNAVPSRRFRHVERFRSEMAINAGSPAKETSDAAGDDASHAPTPRSAGVGRSQ